MKASLLLPVLIALLAGGALCGDTPPPTPPTPPAPAVPATPVDASKAQTLNESGFSMTVPTGFTRLTDAENSAAASGLGETLGKEASERVLRNPAIRFFGPVDRKMKVEPVSLQITSSGLQFNPADTLQCKDMIEDQYRRAGVKYSDLVLDTISVGGVPALRVRHDYIQSSVARTKILMLLIPAADHSYCVVFNYNDEQSALVETAAATVIKTFQMQAPPILSEESAASWKRIAYWTVGCFVVGVLFSLLLKMLSGVNDGPKESKV